MIPFVVPFTNTLAPIMGSPFWSVTVPLTVLVLVDFIVFLRKSSAGAELVSHFPNKPCECVMEREWLGIK